MLLVDTYLSPSKIHGLGVFAKHDIPKNTIIWEVSNLDMSISYEEFENLPIQAQNFIQNHGDWDKFLKRITMSFDNDKYMNHSYNPNVGFNHSTTFALRDIKKNEELTINYFEFDEHANNKLNIPD